MIEINTDRLILRSLKEEDQCLLANRLNNWDVVKYLSHVPYPYTLKDAQEWIERQQQYELSLHLAIILEGELIGSVGLEQTEKDIYTLGFWLAKDFWGQGIATEAATGLIHYATDVVLIEKIHAAYMSGNIASAHVLRKIGFVEIGKEKRFCSLRNKEIEHILMSLEKNSS